MNGMQQTVLVTGADRGLGLSLCEGFIQRGWTVFAGQYMPEWPDLSALQSQYPLALHLLPLDVQSIESARSAAQTLSAYTNSLDMLINNAGIITPSQAAISEQQDYAEIHRLYDLNALGSLRTVEAFLALLQRGTRKRLCFVSSEAG